MTAPQPPAVVWLVRDPATLEPRVAAICPSPEQAREFTQRLRIVNRELTVERWEVPGLE